jgi:hypothetical protein
MHQEVTIPNEEKEHQEPLFAKSGSYPTTV